MKTFKKFMPYLRQHWLPASAGLLLMLMLGAFALGRTHATSHEGGMSSTSLAATPISTLMDTAPAAAQPMQGVATSRCAENGSGKLLLVSISQQHMWACDGQVLVNQSAVTTGSSVVVNGIDDNTPTGTWQIYSKQTNLHLRGSDANGSWDDPVAYWIPYDGAVGFHDANWQTFPFGSSQYQTDGSHGCVHLPTDVAAWVYDWAPIGTIVTVEA